MAATISYLAASASSPSPSLSPSKLSSSPRSIVAPLRRRRIWRQSIRASAVGTHRGALSEGWEISKGSAWFPTFEELDTANMLLKQRIVFLGSQVDGMTADLIISQLLFLDAEDQKNDIKLFINSPGGSTTAGMGIYDAMKLCKADVSTVCFGIAASMGAFLLAAGTKGKRYCMPNARVMLHQPQGMAEGGIIEAGLRLRETRYHQLKMNKILSRITGKSEQQIEKDTKWRNFMNPWESVEYGLVDAVIDDGKPGLIAPIADSSAPLKPTRVWHFWTRHTDRNYKPPSEMNLSQNGLNRSSGSTDKEKGSEQKDAAQAPV